MFITYEKGKMTKYNHWFLGHSLDKNSPMLFLLQELIQFRNIIYMTKNKNNKILQNVHVHSYKYPRTLKYPNTKPKLGYANSRICLHLFLLSCWFKMKKKSTIISTLWSQSHTQRCWRTLILWKIINERLIRRSKITIERGSYIHLN